MIDYSHIITKVFGQLFKKIKDFCNKKETAEEIQYRRMNQLLEKNAIMLNSYARAHHILQKKMEINLKPWLETIMASGGDKIQYKPSIKVRLTKFRKKFTIYGEEIEEG